MSAILAGTPVFEANKIPIHSKPTETTNSTRLWFAPALQQMRVTNMCVCVCFIVCA